MRKQNYLLILIAVVFMLSSFTFATPQNAAADKLQPQLLELAVQDPGQRVSVIVQKVDDAQGVESMVANLEGQVVTDLSIINAFAAEMTAEAAVELAYSDGVRWISLGVPAQGSADSGGKNNPAAR
jgi:hypothetical protein